MDSTKFGENKTGSLVKMAAPDDWAFIPSPLPPTWSFPERLWPLLAEAKAALGELNGIGQVLPDARLLLRPLQRTEALKSSSLEGTYATPKELLLFEMKPRVPRSSIDPANAWREVHNYGLALQVGCHQLDRLPICLRVVREMHQTLLSGVRGRDKRPGEWRQHQVHIGSDRRYVPPPAQHLRDALGSLESYINSEDNSLDPLVRAYVVHYQFEAIHPFYDGNGRVGRLLLALATYKWCKLSLPWLYMSAFFDRYKDEYIEKLFRVSAVGDWDSWVEFSLRGTIEQARDSVRRCKALLEMQRDYVNRLPTGSMRLRHLVDALFTDPFVNIPQAARRMGITYHTAQGDIEKLVAAGILAQLPDFRPKTYYAPGVFGIAYEDEIMSGIPLTGP